MNSEDIKILNRADWYECIFVLKKYWNFDYGTFINNYIDNRKILKLSTGGWSDNEEIINQLSETMFWVMYWQTSRRGGHYTFGIDEEE